MNFGPLTFTRWRMPALPASVISLDGKPLGEPVPAYTTYQVVVQLSARVSVQWLLLVFKES